PTTRFPRKVSMRTSRHWRSGSSSTTSTPRSREGGTDATARRAASIFSPSVRTEASAGSLLRGRGGGWLSRRSWLIARRKGGIGKGSGPKNAWRAHPFPSKPADNRENLRKAQSGPTPTSGFTSGARVGYARRVRPPPLPHQIDVLRRVLRSVSDHPSKPAPAVVFDLDATLFDNRPRTLEILMEYREEVAPVDPELADALLSLEV